jgi:hypothetical protein
MKKLLTALFILSSFSLFAQDCAEIGLTNKTIMMTFLEDNPTGDFEELLYVSNIFIDSTKKTLSYKTESGKESTYNYSSCGYEIYFKEIKQ